MSTKINSLFGLPVRLIRPVAFLLFAALAFSGCQGDTGDSAARSSDASDSAADTRAQDNASRWPEDAAPDFSLTDLDGNTMRLSDYYGHVVLIDFWATWCGPCRRTIPELTRLYNTKHDAGFDILGIALERQDPDKALRPYVTTHKIPYPIALGNRDVVSKYGGIRSIPTAILLGRDGTIRQRFVGVQPNGVLEKAILKLLAEPGPA